MRSSKQHKRCGTSFLLFVMVVSIILFFFIQITQPVYRVVIRIALIPVVAGISYELIRLAGRYDNILTKILSMPGMLLQRLTTREPDKEMVEVAIKSVEAVFDWKEFLKVNFDLDVDAMDRTEQQYKDDDDEDSEEVKTEVAENVAEETEAVETSTTEVAEEAADGAEEEA